MKTWDYLERLRALNKNCTDYRLAIIIGVRHPSMVRYRRGMEKAHGGEMDDDVAARVADLLNMPPLRVIADVRAQREREAGREGMVKIWKHAARMVGTTAAIAICAVTSMSLPSPGEAGTDANSIYYVKRRRWLPSFTGLVSLPV